MNFSRRLFLKQSTIGAATLSLPVALFASTEMDIEKQLLLAKKSWNGKPLVILYPKGSSGNLNPIVSDFVKKTGIQIKLREGSLDNIATEMMLENKVYGGKSFDIALPATFNIPNLVESNIILDLSELAKEHEPEGFKKTFLYDRGDFYKGRFYGYQTDGDTYILFLNKRFLNNTRYQKEYFDKTGKKLDIPKSWEELDRQIKFFNRPKENITGGNLYRNKEYQAWEFWIRLHANKSLPFDSKMNSIIANDKSIKALEALIKLTKHLDSRVKTDGLFDNFKHFAEGKGYANLGWGGTQKYLNGEHSKVKDHLVFAPPPGGIHKNKTFDVPFFNWGWNYTVSANSNNKLTAYLFSLYASSPKVSSKGVYEASGYFDPYRECHYKDQKIINTYSNKFLKTHEYCLKNSIPDLYLSGQGKYLGSLKQAIHNVAEGNLDSELALKTLSKKWDQITELENKRKQLEQWKFLKFSYPKKLHSIFGISNEA